MPTNTLVNDDYLSYEKFDTYEEAYPDAPTNVAAEAKSNVDRRTNLPFGQYSEEEIREEFVKVMTTDTVLDPNSNVGDRVYRDMVINSSPELSDLNRGILDIAKAHFDKSMLASKAFYAMSNVTSEEDIDYLEEAFRLMDESEAVGAKQPIEYLDRGAFTKFAIATAEGSSSTVAIAEDIAPGVAQDVVQGGAMGALAGVALAAPTGELAAPITAGAGAILGAGIAMKVGVPARMFESVYRMGKGELMMQMLRPPKGEERIPIAIAEPIAAKMALLYAALEGVGEIAKVAPMVGLTSSVVARLLAVTGEGATEYSQTLVEQLASHMARKEFARVKGAEFNEDVDDIFDLYEARIAAGQGMMGAGGMQAPSAAYDVSTGTMRFLAGKKQNLEAIKAEANLKAYEVYRRNKLKQVEGKPLNDVRTDDGRGINITLEPPTSTLVKGEPISPIEVNNVKNDAVIKGTNVSEKDLDDLTVITDDMDLGDAIDAIDAKIHNSLDDKTANFFIGLGDFLGNQDQVDVVETLMSARAQTMDMSLSEYVEHHGLEFENLGVEDKELNSYTTFTDDSRAIISAFSNADITSVINELGRVFRRDLKGDLATTADEFVGVEPGAVWDKRAEDKFASGWENYFATGVAPSPEVATLFGKINAWITGVYKTIKGSNIDIEIPPAMRQVYDSLLVKKEIMANNASVTKDDTLTNIPVIEDVVEDVPVIEDVVEDVPIIEDVVEDVPVIEDVVEDVPTKPKVEKVALPVQYQVQSITDENESVDTFIPTELNTIHEAAKSMETAADMADWMIENGTPQQQIIAKRIRKFLTDVPMTVVENGMVAEGGIPSMLEASYGVAYYDRTTGRNAVYFRGTSFGSRAASNITFLHEALHSATTYRLVEAEKLRLSGVTNKLVKDVAKLSDLRKEVFSAYLDAVAEGTVDIGVVTRSGFRNNQEFIAYGMSNTGFQAWLKEVKIGKRTGMSKFVDAIRSVLGFSPKESNALTKLIDITDQIIPKTTVTYKTQEESSTSMEQEPGGVFDAQRIDKRVEDTDSAGAARIKAEREAVNRAMKAYEAEVTKALMTGITEEQVYKQQKIALARAMQRMFDAGDLHGYRMARNVMKAFIARERARFAAQRKHAELKKAIIKKLKDKALPSKSYGKLKIKIDPEVAKVLRDVLEVIGPAKTIGEIRQLYDDRVMGATTFTGGVLSESDKLINQYLDAAVSRNVTGLEKLQAFNTVINDMLNGAGKRSPVMQLKEKLNRLKPGILSDINGGMVVDSPIEDTSRLHDQRQKQKSLKEKARTATLGQYAFLDIRSMIKLATSYSPLLDSTLSQLTDFFNAKQGKMTRIREETAKVHEMYKDAYGIDSSRKMYDRQREDGLRDLDIGAGVLFSRTELRQLWMYMQDPSLTNRLVMMFRDKSQVITNDTTEEESAAIFADAELNYAGVRDAVYNHLTEQDIAFATALKEYFKADEQYDRINPVYEKVFGVPLGRVDEYVPIRSQYYLNLGEQLDEATKYTQFKHDNYIRKTATSAKSIRERVKDADKYQLSLQGDISLFASYTEEMSHFENFAEQAEIALLALNDKDIRRAIEIEYGPKLYKSIMSSLDDVLADGIHNRNQVPFMDRWRSSFVVSTIGMATSVFLKQQISVVQYAQHMPWSDLIGGLAKFWMNPINNIAEMFETEYIKNRKSLIDRDLKRTLLSTEFKKYQLNPVTSNFLTLNVQIGDALAISQGAWAFKEYLKNQVNPDTGTSYTDKEALAKAFRLSEQTQQSGMMQHLSPLQRAGSVAQFATMYSTGPVQAIRQEIDAARDFIGGKITRKQFAKTIFIYHFLVPSLFAVAGSALTGDDKEDALKTLLIANILGPFGAAYAAGAVVTEALRRRAGLRRYDLDGAFADVTLDIFKLTEVFNENKELDLDDYTEAIQAMMVMSGYGIPIQRVERSLVNASRGDIKGTIFSTNPEK